MTAPSLRTIEAKLRASGMSAAEAKRVAPERLAAWERISPEGQPIIMSTVLKRAFDKFAPIYRYVAEFPNTADTRFNVLTLQKARAALLDGADPTDPTGWDERLALIDSALKEIDAMIASKRDQQAESVRSARPVAGQEVSGGFSAYGGAPRFRDASTGRALRTYRHDEPIAGDGGQPDWGLGDMVRAACTGDWSRLPSHVRAGSAGIGASGGFLIPSELSGHVVDLARAKARVLQAGAQTMPMNNGNLSVAVVTGDPQGEWRAENSPFAVSQGSYGRLELTTKMLGVIVPLSLELVMSASNINELVTGQITQSLGLKLDSAAIAGDGTVNMPRGIVANLPAGNIFPVGGELASETAYRNWGTAIGKVLAANAELSDLSILHNSDVETALDGLQDTLYQPLRPTPNFAAIKDKGRVYVANGMLTSGTPPAATSIVGDFHQVLFGMQQSLMIEVSRDGGYVANGETVNAFANGQVLIRALIACDIAILRPTWFAEVSDIRFA